MKYNQYKFKANVWLYPGMAGWHFASVSHNISEDIKHNFGNKKKGWGSLPIIATIGKTSWKSSIFQDKETKGYLLPLKAQVRKEEGIVADDKIDLLLKIRV